MIVAVLQARYTSSRMPGKVMRPLLGYPMLWRQIERIRYSRRINQLVVATSTDTSDDPIADMCRRFDVTCFRGSLEDVLDRFYQAARPYGPTDVVRLTGDCPLIDPQIIDEVIGHHQAGHFDYTSNTLQRTCPDGLDVEVMRHYALEAACKEAELPSMREHVTPFIYRHPDRFQIGQWTQAEDWSALRWTVDEPEDFELIRKIYEALYPDNSRFGQAEIMAWLHQRPELSSLNAGIEMNEGYRKSLEEDTLFLQKR